ncbi:MAG: TolC family protein, partial [Deferribacterales bacterium]|nr:TolC family protein [Deferribacterales bacterium]
MYSKFTFKRFVTVVAFFALAGFLLIGCAPVGPDYKKVGFESPDNWSTEMDRGLSMSQPEPNTLAEWWKVFNDPTLENLQKKAVSGNKDLKIALSRIRQARYMRGITKSNLFPQLDATGTFQSTMGSENMGTPTGGDEQKYYMAGFDVAWELDIFGGLRRSVEAAQAELEAMFADFNDVYITLMSEVALNYIEACMYKKQLSILYQNVDIQRKIYELNKSRYESGIIDELVLQQSLTNLNQSMSQIPPLVAMLSAAKNRIAILIGEMPENIN